MSPVDIVFESFSRSVSLGFTVSLIVWLVSSWWFVLSSVGGRQLSAQILSGFTVDIHGRTSLAQLAPTIAISSKEVEEGRVWEVSKLFLLYWLFAFRKAMVIAFTVIMLFVLLSFVVFYMAQPASGISLMNVVEGMGLFFVFCFILKVIVSAACLLLSASRLPLSAVEKRKAYKIIILAW